MALQTWHSENTGFLLLVLQVPSFIIAYLKLLTFFIPSMQVVVTGASGFIGSHLVDRF